jgi:hypothetical protein
VPSANQALTEVNQVPSRQSSTERGRPSAKPSFKAPTEVSQVPSANQALTEVRQVPSANPSFKPTEESQVPSVNPSFKH